VTDVATVACDNDCFSVAAKSEKNLMTVSNLGVCFGPTLLRPEEETVASIMDLKFYNIVVEILIENYDKIFNSEPDKTLPSENTSPRNPPPGINYKHAGDHQVANYAPEGVDLYRNYNSNHSNHVGQPYMRPHMTCVSRWRRFDRSVLTCVVVLDGEGLLRGTGAGQHVFELVQRPRVRQRGIPPRDDSQRASRS
jgi:hypothetical protein